MSVKLELKEGFVSIDGFDTLPKLFRNRVEKWGDNIAMREKNFGIWESFTWKDFNSHVREIAAGLLSFDIKPDDVVAILSEANKEWVFADMATMAAGGIVNGIYPTYQAGQVVYGLKDSNARFLFVENEEQLDKYLNICDELPNVKKVFVMDWKGLSDFTHEKVESLSSLYKLGAKYLQKYNPVIDERIDAGKNDDVAVLVYTSGTTGKPKGTQIQHSYLLFLMSCTPDPMEIYQDDELLTYLPLCHLLERVVSLCLNLGVGTRINFAESSQTVFQNIQELSPTVLFAVPRIWEKFYSRVNTLMSEATWTGRTIYNFALSIGMKRADTLMADKKPSFFMELAHKIVDQLVFKNIKQLLGLDRTHYLLTGAAPVSSDLLKWYLALGLKIEEGYGQTETGFATMTRKDSYRPGTVGRPLENVEVKLSEQGEIMVKSPALLKGYLNNEEGTKSTKVDGWVMTGDIGEFDEEGNLSITDRIKDIIITAGGKNITPSQMENNLKFSPYISDSIIIGDKRKYLSCLIMIDEENVEHFAQTNSIPFTDYKSLCARKEVIELIEEEVKKANKKVSSVEQIKKFRLIDILLTAEDDELTPTMKLKRSFVEKKYKDLIDQMY
jgi:long-chain acyl-CoA synthetase